MEIFLFLVVTAVYGPLLLLLYSARRETRLASMERSARAAYGSSNSIKVASLNIRFSPSNQGPNPPSRPLQEHPWVMRKEALVDQLLYEMPDIVCLQEVMWHQMEDIDSLVGSIYGHITAGREDGKRQGEACPILWNKDHIDLLSFEHFWLSDQPHVPGSVGWDAALSRMATLGKFQWKTPSYSAPRPKTSSDEEINHEDGEIFYVLNTHYDHIGFRAREQSSKLILTKLRSLMDKSVNGEPPLVIMTGDLNSPPYESGYQVITGHRYANKNGAADAHTFYDTRHELLTRGDLKGVPLQRKSYGANGTFTDFDSGAYKDHVIDFVLVADNGALTPGASGKTSGYADGRKWAVTRAGVLPNIVENGQYPFRLSDHNMVTALLTKSS